MSVLTPNKTHNISIINLGRLMFGEGIAGYSESETKPKNKHK
jgi:hypothetical protein